MSELIRDGDPHGFGSHLPVLKMVLALVKPRKVLELGTGYYSTPSFLHCETVKQLVSLETDPEWAGRVEGSVDDTRLDLRSVTDVVKEMPPLSAFDLVFVDNGQSVHERVDAIRAVLGAASYPVAVVHDAEYPDYRMAIAELAANSMIFDDPQHQTAVCWT
jgi:predicted O-methyltransferase YrrM